MKISNFSIVVTTLSLVFGFANGQLPACVIPPYSDPCASIPNPSLVVACNCMPPSFQQEIVMFVAGFQLAADAMLPKSCYEEQYLQYIADLISGLASDTGADPISLSTRECPTFPSFVGSSAALTCPLILYESPRKADVLAGLCLTEECAIPAFMSYFMINLMMTPLSCRESCEGLPAEFGCNKDALVPPGGCSAEPIAAPMFPSCPCVNDFWPKVGETVPGPCDRTCDSSSMFDISISNGVSFPYPHCTQGCKSDNPDNIDALAQIWIGDSDYLGNNIFCPDEGDSVTVTLSDKPFKGSKSCNDGNKRLCKGPNFLCEENKEDKFNISKRKTKSCSQLSRSSKKKKENWCALTGVNKLARVICPITCGICSSPPTSCSKMDQSFCEENIKCAWVQEDKCTLRKKRLIKFKQTCEDLNELDGTLANTSKCRKKKNNGDKKICKVKKGFCLLLP